MHVYTHMHAIGLVGFHFHLTGSWKEQNWELPVAIVKTQSGHEGSQHGGSRVRMDRDKPMQMTAFDLWIEPGLKADQSAWMDWSLM